MWKYSKKLEYPVNIKNKDLNVLKALFSLYAGSNSELTSALTYLNQRFTMPDERGYALLTDIGTEELAHYEIIGTMIHQLLKNTTINEIKDYNLIGYYSMNNKSNAIINPDGVSFTSNYVSTTGNFLADLESDMANEQRARVTYENIMNLTEDESILGPLSFLRQREIIHYIRFKELKDYYLNKYKK